MLPSEIDQRILFSLRRYAPEARSLREREVLPLAHRSDLSPR